MLRKIYNVNIKFKRAFIALFLIYRSNPIKKGWSEMKSYIKHFVGRKPISTVMPVFRYESYKTEEELTLIDRYCFKNDERKTAFDIIVLAEKVLHRMMIDSLDYYNFDNTSKSELKINTSTLSLAESQMSFNGMNYSAIKELYESKLEEWNAEYPEFPRTINESLLLPNSPIIMVSDKLNHYFQKQTKLELTPLIKNVLKERSEGIPFKDIGERYGYSIEWIRKLELKGKGVIYSFLYRTQSSLMNISEQINKEYITFDDLVVVFKRKGAIEVDYVIQQQDSPLNPMIKPLFHMRFYSNEDKAFDNYRDSYEKIGRTLLKNRIGLFDKDTTLEKEIMTLFHEYGYPIKKQEAEKLKADYITDFQKKADYLPNKTLTRKEVFETIQKDYFPNGVNPYDLDDMKKFYDILKREFGIQYANPESVSMKITKHLYLIDVSLYGREELFEIDSNLFNDILLYIEHSPTLKILYKELYETFEEQLVKHSTINNHEMLHGYLSIQEKELEGVQLTKGSLIKENKEIKIDGALDYYQVIADEIAKKPLPYTMEEVAELMNDQALDKDSTRIYLMNNVPELVSWGDKRLFNLKSIKLTTQQKKLIREVILESVNNKYHYTSIYKVLKQVKEILGTEISQVVEKPRHVFNIIEFHCHKELKRVLLTYPHMILKKYWKKEKMTTIDFINLILDHHSDLSDDSIKKIMTDIYGKKDSSQIYKMLKIREERQ